MEYIHGLALIIAQCKGVSRQGNLAMSKFEGSAFEVARAIFDWESDARESLFEVPPVQGQDADAVGVESLFNIGLDGFVATDFEDDYRVFGRQDERVAFFVEIDFAIAAHGLADFNADILGNVVFAVGFEGGDDFFGGDACCGCIPERERIDAVRVYVLGAFFQFGKAHEPISRGFVSGRVDFHENREVALDNEGIFGIVVHVFIPALRSRNMRRRDDCHLRLSTTFAKLWDRSTNLL